MSDPEDDPLHPPRPLPATIEPMLWAHLLVSGDVVQQQAWRERIEAIEQARALDHATDPEVRSIIASPRAWRQIRETGRLGATYGMGMGTMWMAWLLPTYALGHGFGWLAAASFLLAVPLAWRVGRRSWERAALAGMVDTGRKPSPRRRFRSFGRGVFRSFAAGYSFGFTLVFLQALMTWFMTPAPTLAMELLLDLYHGAVAGLISGGMSVILAPLASRKVPDATEALPAHLDHATDS